jgi:predicted ATPase
LIGRDRDIPVLARLIQRARIVSVVGTGGIGKTRLAQAAVFALKDEFPDGVWIVELAPICDSELIPAAVAGALGTVLPGQKAALQEVADAIRDSSMLLLLDNCEHLVSAAGVFAQTIFDRTHRVHIVTTSQELLKLAEEQVYRVTALSVPEADDSSAALASDAVRLLIHRIEGVQPGFAPSSDDLKDSVEICRRLDGLPLAIELAAARVPFLGLSGVRGRLAERLHVLNSGARIGLPRHRTLRATLEWSHNLLSPNEQEVFRRCGVFAGGFQLAFAQEVVGDNSLDEWAVLDHLGALVDKSLVVVDLKDPPRYHLLESARAYACENLKRCGEADAISRRHAASMVAQMEKSWSQRWEIASQILLQNSLPELDNCRAALEWAAHSDNAIYVGLAGASAWLFSAAGQAEEGKRHCEAALLRVGTTTPPAIEARLHFGLCGLAHYSAWAGKCAAAERAVGLYRTVGSRASLYSALGRLAITASLSGDCAAGERAIDEMQTLWNPEWPALARWDLLNARDYVANLQGRREEGEALALEQHALALAFGDTPKLLFAMMALEQCAAARGNFAEAVERGRELVARARRERYVERLQVYIANLATALVMSGALDEALVVARESAEADRRTGTLWQSLDLFATLAFKRGRIDDAARILGRAEAANKWRGAFREPVERLVRDELMSKLESLLTTSELQSLLDEGSSLDDETATRIALAD